MQRSRRTDPYPLTWEIPVAVAGVLVMVTTYGVHLGRAVANVLAGGGWTWPTAAWLFRSVPGVISGNASAGLTRPITGAPPTLLRVCLVVTELVLILVLGVVAKVGWDRWGPTRIRGLATRAVAEQLLGRSRLRTAAPVVRPDLYGKEARR